MFDRDDLGVDDGAADGLAADDHSSHHGVRSAELAPPNRAALDALEAGIDAAHPRSVIAARVTIDGDELRVADRTVDLSEYDEIVVLGGGNAAGRVAAALDEQIGDRVDGGVVVTDDPASARAVETVEGTHPLPSESNVTGTRRLLDRARECDEGTLALVAVTGGGSALLTAPSGDIELDELVDLTESLLKSGAPIEAINTVRRAISDVKGGGLAAELAPATTIGLVFSDVTSDDPAVVASGPLSPNPTDAADALDVLSDYDVDAPSAVVEHLERAAAESSGSAAGPGLDHVSVHVLADGFTALAAAADACEDAGYDSLILSRSVRGEAREAAKTHVALAEEAQRTGNPVSPPAVVLSGGETTVTVVGDGTGGPNQEFALSAATDIPEGVVLGAVDTDGIDGATDAAGALVTSETIAGEDDARAAAAALADNDAYPYLDERGALLVSGPTGTNVNDLRVLVVTE
ncbi:glycerate kinase type-2 family protein [Halorubrum trueperi]|uniref:Glycerate kinase n=1 Tax=Halorubrum trueperi TaxID=2004704 RepID=A0ABD5UIZ9_9EURY